MLDNLDANPNLLVKPAFPGPRMWLAAITRPIPATYREIADNPQIGLGAVYGWLLGSGLIGGLLGSMAGVFTGTEWGGLALAIVIFALAHTCACVIFAAGVHGVARLLRGRGRYSGLMKAFAAFNVPLVLLAGLFALIPRVDLLLVGLYLYWMYLYIVAVRAVYRVSWVGAGASVLGALLLLGSVVIGLGYLSTLWN